MRARQGRLSPDTQGEQVLAATRKLFAAIETFKGEAQGMADKLLGELRIGLSEALSDEVLERIGAAIGRFRRRNQAVQIELLSAMPAELERRLLQDQLQLAIGYFSGSQTALDYQPLFEERQRLYCARQHPLFGRDAATADDLLECDRVLHPYRFIAADEPWQGGISSARCEQVEGSLAFILSGAHLGYLPEHIAQPWVSRGSLRALSGDWDFIVQFRLASHRGHPAGEAQKAFSEDLLNAFGITPPG